MKNIVRRSAVEFGANSLKIEERGNWMVVLEYMNEGDGPWLVDLTHKERFDLQDSAPGEITIDEISMPDTPGQSRCEKQIVVNRMNPTQVSIYNLGDDSLEVSGNQSFTEVTEATVFLALFGKNIFQITEKLSSLDFMSPKKEAPFLLQGPFCHVPCQIVTLQKNNNNSGGILLTCSRGYAQNMIEALLDAGAEFGLLPAGEDRFTGWFKNL